MGKEVSYGLIAGFELCQNQKCRKPLAGAEAIAAYRASPFTGNMSIECPCPSCGVINTVILRELGTAQEDDQPDIS